MSLIRQLQQLMNFSYHHPPNFASPEEAAFYYNSLCFSYDFYSELHQNQNVLFAPIQHSSSFQGFPQEIKLNNEQQRPTDDMQSYRGPLEPEVKIQVKIQQNFQQNQQQLNQIKQQFRDESFNPKIGQEKNLKKNTESNLINNVFSYICSECKSHRTVMRLVKDNLEKMKIFYIFANNLKRLNSKYLNRKNIKAVCEIVPKQQLFKMISKSIKRLLILPLQQLRITIRKLIFNYLRGPQSILPLLTSKKICKIALREHMNRRRDLSKFLESSLKHYS